MRNNTATAKDVPDYHVWKTTAVQSFARYRKWIYSLSTEVQYRIKRCSPTNC